MTPGNSRSFALRLVAACLFLLVARVAFAHPMGNFSINHYAGIRLGDGSIEILYIIDRAEIPTYQETQDAGINTVPGDPSLPAYLAREAAQWNTGITLSVNGQPVHLIPVSKSVLFPPGAGGLPTMKIGVVFRGSLPRSIALSGSYHVHYADQNFPGHAGWKEIVVTAEGRVTLDPAQPFKIDRSAQLTDYPTDLLNSPPQNLEADLNVTVSAPPLAQPLAAIPTPVPHPAPLPATVASPPPTPAATVEPAPIPATVSASTPLVLRPNKQATPRNRFTELMTARHTSLWFLFTAALLAAGLGAAHALEPGHGKTIVAAYLVGSRGRTRHAIGLGLLVTASHTAGVYLLGAVVLYASKYIIPERIYPWLSIFSGLVIAALATYLLLRAWTGVESPEDGEDGVLHTHWYSLRRNREEVDAIEDSVSQSSGAQEKAISLRQLLLLGITGGIIPCPAALVVLLSAVSLHRIGFGLFLIVAFSLGLATVLVTIGIVMVKARGLLSRWRSDSPIIQRWLPIASSSAMLIAGLAIAATAFKGAGLGFNLSSLTGNSVGSFIAVVGLGLVLGMRHSTDPDHVVAVSTIVSRERSVKQGAVIGMMWGMGHTLTIFIVGALIILFKLTIPPRIGLSMEMAVAFMLILLGILNLTGVLQRITQRLTPARWTNASAPDPLPSDRSPVRQPLPRRLLERFGWYQLLRPLAIGLVHGLAGSAAVALLVLSMIHSPAWAIAYLVVFGFGTVLGMMLMTTVMAIPIALTGKSFSRYLTVASGLVSVCFGVFLVYHLGFVDGLFTSHVHWTPE